MHAKAPQAIHRQAASYSHDLHDIDDLVILLEAYYIKAYEINRA
jgi:hypothetical protein